MSGAKSGLMRGVQSKPTMVPSPETAIANFRERGSNLRRRFTKLAARRTSGRDRSRVTPPGPPELSSRQRAAVRGGRSLIGASCPTVNLPPSACGHVTGGTPRVPTRETARLRRSLARDLVSFRRSCIQVMGTRTAKKSADAPPVQPRDPRYCPAVAGDRPARRRHRCRPRRPPGRHPPWTHRARRPTTGPTCRPTYGRSGPAPPTCAGWPRKGDQFGGDVVDRRILRPVVRVAGVARLRGLLDRLAAVAARVRRAVPPVA